MSQASNAGAERSAMSNTFAASLKRLHGRRQVLGVLTALALAGMGLYHAGRYLWVEQHLRAARQAEEHGNLAEARVHLAAALRGRPGGGPIRLRAARLAWRAEDYEGAADHLRAYER